MTIESLHKQASNRDRMIPHLRHDWDRVHWREQLKDCITSSDDLLEMVGLQNHIKAVNQPSFTVRIPRRWAERIRKGDAQDPILLQVLAQPSENEPSPGYTCDPLKESHFMPTNGVIHKYQHRVLLVLTSACAVNCRYCFRRSFPYSDNIVSGERLKNALSYVKSRNDIFEVILSGGDPLMLSNERLSDIIAEIEDIPHITNLRIHSRLPVMIPERVDAPLLRILRETSLAVTLVLHCNHHQEIPPTLGRHIRKLMGIGVYTLNQSVLLQSINDSAQSLIELSRELYRHSVLPYYLHRLDPVQGASHFEVTSETKVKALYQTLLDSLPGFLVPKLVREVPGNTSKTPVCIRCQS